MGSIVVDSYCITEDGQRLYQCRHSSGRKKVGVTELSLKDNIYKYPDEYDVVIDINGYIAKRNGDSLIEIAYSLYLILRALEQYRDVNGARKSPFYMLTENDIGKLLDDIKFIEADVSVFRFNDDRVRGTGYIDAIDRVIIRGNVFPDTVSGSKHPRDIMSTRAVLAHEYYEHRVNRNTDLAQGCWEDEYRASRTAAEITPNLTDEERRHLVLDAIERKREAGIKVELDDFMRRILYDIE